MSKKIRKRIANLVALVGPTKAHRRRIRQWVLGNDNQAYSSIMARVQDLIFPLAATKAKRVMVIVVPEHDAMSGGIYSMFSIANHMHALRREHGYHVLVMSRPNRGQETYIRNSAFRNSETVYRFDKLLECPEVEELYLHLPEYCCSTFLEELSSAMLKYLFTRKKLFINILNQNIKLMPKPSELINLRNCCSNLTQSVAHHAYYNQQVAEKYDLPTLLLPAYTDLTQYPASSFEDKKKLIIYSWDEAPHKSSCLAAIRRGMPEFTLLEIKGITFDHYMELATDCMFSISFGEGFDGYLAQPIHQGGIGLTVYNDEFFPASHFKKYFNIFATPEEMQKQIVTRMKQLSSDPKFYTSINREMINEYDKLYSFNDYIAQIRKLALRKFEIIPKKV